MGYSYLDTHPSTNAVKQGLTLLSGQNMLLSLWYCDYAERILLKFLRWEKVSSKEEKYLILHGWKSREQKD